MPTHQWNVLRFEMCQYGMNIHEFVHRCGGCGVRYGMVPTPCNIGPRVVCSADRHGAVPDAEPTAEGPDPVGGRPQCSDTLTNTSHGYVDGMVTGRRLSSYKHVVNSTSSEVSECTNKSCAVSHNSTTQLLRVWMEFHTSLKSEIAPPWWVLAGFVVLVKSTPFAKLGSTKPVPPSWARHAAFSDLDDLRLQQGPGGNHPKHHRGVLEQGTGRDGPSEPSRPFWE